MASPGIGPLRAELDRVCGPWLMKLSGVFSASSPGFYLRLFDNIGEGTASWSTARILGRIYASEAFSTRFGLNLFGLQYNIVFDAQANR